MAAKEKKNMFKELLECFVKCFCLCFFAYFLAVFDSSQINKINRRAFAVRRQIYTYKEAKKRDSKKVCARKGKTKIKITKYVRFVGSRKKWLLEKWHHSKWHISHLTQFTFHVLPICHDTSLVRHKNTIMCS